MKIYQLWVYLEIHLIIATWRKTTIFSENFGVLENYIAQCQNDSQQRFLNLIVNLLDKVNLWANIVCF